MLSEAMGKLQREEGAFEMHSALMLARKKYPSNIQVTNMMRHRNRIPSHSG